MYTTKTRGVRNLTIAAGSGFVLTCLAGGITFAAQDAAGFEPVKSAALHVSDAAPRRVAEEPVPPSLRFGFDPTRAMVYQMFDPLDVPALMIEDEQNLARGIEPLRIGLVRDFEYPLNEQDLAGWQEIPQGRIWAATVLCAEATSIRAHFSDVDLPVGAELWVYAPGQSEPAEVFYADFGPMAQDSFWTKHFPGDVLYVEYFVPTGVEDTGTFTIDKAVHNYRSDLGYLDDDGDGGLRWCMLDVMCYPAWHPLHNATARIQFTSGGGSYLCSATLMVTQTADETPYVLTAEHCIGNQAEAQSISWRWFYQTASCDGPNASFASRSAGDFLWSRSQQDASLVMALGALPEGLTWAGWETGTVATGTNLVGIHHPGGQRKKISFGHKLGWPHSTSNYHGVHWNSGTISGGSSGSGLYRQSTQNYVGVASYSALPHGCDNPEGPSGYGRFDRFYQYISGYLFQGSDDQFSSGGQTNDVCEDAALIGSGTYDNLIVKSTAEDWYALGVPDGEELNVTVNFTNAYGNIDIKLYDACGGVLLDSSEGFLNSETVNYTNLTGSTQICYLHVYLVTGTRNSYNMIVETGEYVPPMEHLLVEVPITQAAIDDDPTLENAQTFDLRVVIEPGDDWTTTDGTATVDGTIYQHPIGIATPAPDFWGTYPALEFDSFFSAPNFTQPSFATGPDITTGSMSALWFDTADTGGGTFTVARFTMTAGTTLSVSGSSSLKSTWEVLHPFNLTVDLDITDPGDCLGDINGDGERGHADLAELLAAYGSFPGDPNWNPNADLDGDDHVGHTDLALFLSVYGIPCP